LRQDSFNDDNFRILNVVEMAFPPDLLEQKWRAGRPTFGTASFLFWWGERFIRSVTDQELRALHHQTFFDRDANRDLCRSACQLQISHKSATGILEYGNVWR
jgi:hypothetical protein